MSSIFQDARVKISISDFAIVDAIGKLNIVGGAISFLHPDPATGVTAPFCAAIEVLVPQKHSGTQYTLSVALYDVTNDKQVQLPNGPTGQLQAMQVAQVVTVPHLQLPPDLQPPTDAFMNYAMVLNFGTGLPLTPGTYEWRAHIDTQSRQYWSARFHVPQQIPGPVFGGPGSPASIPGFGIYQDQPSDDATGDSQA